MTITLEALLKFIDEDDNADTTFNINDAST